jgi:hypothetical protein
VAVVVEMVAGGAGAVVGMVAVVAVAVAVAVAAMPTREVMGRAVLGTHYRHFGDCDRHLFRFLTTMAVVRRVAVVARVAVVGWMGEEAATAVKL